MSDNSLEALLDVSGVGRSTLDDIQDAGYDHLSDFSGVDRSNLKQISGVGSSTANNILRFLDKEGYREQDEATENQRRFQDLLRDLFQFDTADLDFGIYPIMNQKQDVIDEFIEHDLINVVNRELEEYSETELAEIKAEVEEARQEVEENLPDDAFDGAGRLNSEYEDFPVGKRYLKAVEQLEAHEVSEATEAQIFNDLYQFFNRYYEEGDFVPQRRHSSNEKYSVPYNGEETHFHWANKNQYFTKTDELFTNYQFNTGGLSVSLELHDAEVSSDNSADDEDRYFVLHRRNPINYDSTEMSLTVRFEYRPIDQPDYERYDTSSRSHNKQRDIREQAAQEILNSVPNQTANLLTQAAHNSTRELLDYHLYQYTTKYTSDYFIHKDIGGFLEDELDFYLKNEVLGLDVGSASLDHVEQELARARVVEEIGMRVIRFIAQIEDFQKVLWEKTKFVTSTEYCITLDKIPKRFYSTLLQNEAQIEAWRELYDFADEDGGEGLDQFTEGTVIDEEFLANHPYMMVDTQYFGQEFKNQVLSCIPNLEQEIDGILVQGENYQTLNLLMEKFRGDISSIYIDPPYNTGNKFIYKDNYQHSSWLSMVQNRVELAQDLLSDTGLFFSSIDDNELNNLAQLLDDTLGEQVNLVVVRNNPKGRGLDQYLAKSHDYLLTYAKQSTELSGIPKGEEQIAEQYKQKDERGRYRLQPLRNTHREFNSDTRENMWYPLYVDTDTREVYIEDGEGREEVYPLWNDGFEGCWTWDPEKARKDLELLTGKKSGGRWKVYRKDYAMEGGEPVTYTPKTIWDDNDMRTEVGQEELDDIIGEQVFRAPKPPALIKRAIQLSTGDGEYVLDFFAGSGTTAHSVISLNRERDTNKNYILADMGDHLMDIAKPRIQRLVYSDNWNEGSPQNKNGISHMFKYHKLESYEDSLENISLTGEHQSALDSFDDYLLEYMLEFETRKSATRLNIDELSHPFEYELKLARDDGPDTTTVDLVETFNYLIGLEVSSIAPVEHQDRTYRVVRGSKGEETVCVIWRRSEDLDLADERQFIEDEVITGDEDLVYTNGDSFISGAKSLEAVFKNRMGA